MDAVALLQLCQLLGKSLLIQHITTTQQTSECAAVQLAFFAVSLRQRSDTNPQRVCSSGQRHISQTNVFGETFVVCLLPGLWSQLGCTEFDTPAELRIHEL